MSNISTQSWRLDRRTFLRGAGAALALPALNCMAAAKPVAAPRRLAAVYFPFGVSIQMGDKAKRPEWNWFPQGEGRDFKFTENLKPLEAHREHLSVLGGLSHPKVRRIGGHDSGDTFLTGHNIRANHLRNRQSMDQVAAAKFAGQTRFDSLVMSTDGGVGEPTRSSTLSYNEHGRPIPALNQPQQIFDRLFGAGDADTARQARRLKSGGSLLDLVLEDAARVRRNLGKYDQQKFDEYLDSVRQVERRVERAQKWMHIPKPGLTDADRERLELESDSKVPREYVATMYELMHLAFLTDSTRVATYQIASMGDATTLGGKFPQLLGLGKHLHGLCHGWNREDGIEPLGKWDQFLAGQFATFLHRMRNTPVMPESEASLLDHTTIIYGCSNSTTHNNKNYPLVLAGGRGIGFQHGQYVKYGEDTPFANVFATMLQQTGVTDRFADSTGVLPELLG